MSKVIKNIKDSLNFSRGENNRCEVYIFDESTTHPKQITTQEYFDIIKGIGVKNPQLKTSTHFIDRLNKAINRLDILISNREEENDNPV